MQAACLLGISRLSALCYANNRVGREAGWLAGLFVTRWRKPQFRRPVGVRSAEGSTPSTDVADLMCRVLTG